MSCHFKLPTWYYPGKIMHVCTVPYRTPSIGHQDGLLGIRRWVDKTSARFCIFSKDHVFSAPAAWFDER